MTTARHSDVLVELHVPDLALAGRFYRRFGFRVAREEQARQGNGYLVLRRASSILCFWGGRPAVRDHPYFRRFRRVRKRGYAVEIVVPVRGLDRLYGTARAAGCVVEDLRDRPWGARDFRIEDPFGFYLRFTEPYDALRAVPPAPARRRAESAAARATPRRRS
ncbi:MAG: VOC family protein [Chloroflexota bacterium]